MKRTAQDILNFVEDNDVKFVKLTFCDIFGNQKNVSLFASELPRAFEQGISFDGSSIAGFMNIEESDLILWPDPDTATVLPWRPAEGRVMRMYCDITLRTFRWTTAAILTSRRSTRARTSAAISACPSRRWACSPSTATTRAARARTRSASAMHRL